MLKTKSRIVRFLQSLQQERIYGKTNEQSVLVAIGLSLARDATLDHGFKVFSQYNEDGIIQAILKLLPEGLNPPKTFIEIGVQDYSESNTRFLLQGLHWNGKLVDASIKLLNRLKSSELAWRYNPEIICDWVTVDNFNEHSVFADGRPPTLLSLDIDGNDYWLLERLDSKPLIICCEFNPILGFKLPLVVPYDPDFCRFTAHYSGEYYGASLKAFINLLMGKGYTLVAIGGGLNNAFFVRSEYWDLGCPSLAKINSTRLTSNDHRSLDGMLAFPSYPQRIKAISGCKVINTLSGELLDIGECNL